MKINLNSLKAHQLFPNETHYNLSFSHSNDEILDNRDLPDNYNNRDLKHISEIIKHAKSLKNIIPANIFNEITIQVNVNDYYDHLDKNKFERHDFSFVNMYAYPKDKVLIWGVNYKDNHYVTQEITQHLTVNEEVNFTLFHEVSHMLEYVHIKEIGHNKANILSDKIINFFNERKNSQIQNNEISENKLESMLITLSSEMYADTMAILLAHHVFNNTTQTINLLEKIIIQREKESLYSLSCVGSPNGLPYSPGITSDHFTVPALQKLKEEIEVLPKILTSLDEMNQLVEKCVSFGLMKNILFMSKIKELQPQLLVFFKNVLGCEINEKALDDLLHKEIDSLTFNEMTEALCDENLNKTKYRINSNMFKAVFHPTVWEEENTPMKMRTPEEYKEIIEFIRNQSLFKDSISTTEVKIS